MEAPLRAQGSVGVLPERIAGALAYLTFVPAVIFLLLDPYRKNPFVRFHSFQCIFLSAAVLLAAVLLRLLAVLLFIIPMVGQLLVLLTSVVVGLAAFVIWLVLLVKALQGDAFRLPWIGDLAAQMAEEI